jgi:16S rRNA (uracil1498-N3)-methyltransferase
MNTYFSDSIMHNQAILDATESDHCLRVMRQRAGERIQVIDGKGGLYEGILTPEHAKLCRVTELTKKEYRARHPFLHLAVAPTKSTDRYEWFIEKAVEIGIDIITPMLCERSERRLVKPERLQKIMISSMKQAVVPRMPLLRPTTPFERLVEMPDRQQTRLYIAHCSDENRVPLTRAWVRNHQAMIMIGPEGDFSPDEIQRANQSGFVSVSLGTNRLRTETAALVACLTANLMEES